MVEKILPGLFRIKIPLPKNPLKYVNSYLVVGENRSLIIDTGMNMDECLVPMLDALKKLNVDLNRTDFFITHLHADHLGLVDRLASNSEVYFSEIEAPLVKLAIERPEIYWREILQFYRMNGFPETEIKKILGRHPGIRYSSRNRTEFHPISDGDVIKVGDFSLTAILTPGHSPGHMCLYEPERKILFSGDHILFDITPNITWWPVMKNSLKEYLRSLERVYSLDVSIVLPGHRNIWKDHRKRIDELKKHHQKRLNEVLSALKDGEKTAWDVAPHISWDIEFKIWDELPVTQKWFAVGETIAHLIYLEEEGKVEKKEVDHKVLYSLH
jgi:glyoxylase-like metal-dependent hydrolase (beta-lactamase superfamily II)